MNEQLDLFASLYEKPKLPKHVRLIECFAGIGAQAKALEVLGVDFEHWRTVEWSWQSITAYNAIHMGGRVEDTSHLTYEEVLKRISGVSHDYNQPMTEEQLRRKGEAWARELLGRMIANNNVCPDVSRVHAEDLDIRERENNLYILTYSFPCQDLSLAGQMKGFEKGSGTRSGLLWEIERILNECGSELPQVLVMENVPGVCSSKNKVPWQDWLDTLHGMGYTSYLKIINAKNCSIPQNRERAFLVSILGEFSYKFQSKAKLRYLLKDFIKSEVDENYYLSDEMLKGFLRFNENQDKKGNGFKFEPTNGASVAHAILSDANNRPCDNFIIARERDPYPLRDGEDHLYKLTVIVSDKPFELKEGEKTKALRYRIRKLTEGECYRLMGFEEEDTEACKAVGQSKANIYHQAGDSIVTTVLMGIFGELLEVPDYQAKIEAYADKLAGECK